MRSCARAAAFATLALCGCAMFGPSNEPMLRALEREEYPRALAELDKHREEGSVHWQSQRGLLLRYNGRLGESNEAFAAALSRQEDLFTRSVSNEAAALAVNDLLRPYRARDYELPFLHVYPALNYLELGDLEGAMVEARALS